MDSLATAFPFKDPVPRIVAVEVSEQGRAVSISFNVVDDITKDGDRAVFVFEFSSAWLHAASPLLCNKDYSRKTNFYLDHNYGQSCVTRANPVKNGLILCFESNVTGKGTYTMKDTFPACFLFACLLYTSPSPRDQRGSRMPSSA